MASRDYDDSRLGDTTNTSSTGAIGSSTLTGTSGHHHGTHHDHSHLLQHEGGRVQHDSEFLNKIDPRVDPSTVGRVIGGTDLDVHEFDDKVGRHHSLDERTHGRHSGAGGATGLIGSQPSSGYDSTGRGGVTRAGIPDQPGYGTSGQPSSGYENTARGGLTGAGIGGEPGYSSGQRQPISGYDDTTRGGLASTGTTREPDYSSSATQPTHESHRHLGRDTAAVGAGLPR